MCHQVTCNAEFNCKLIHFILYFHKHLQLGTLLNFLFSEQYIFYSTKLTLFCASGGDSQCQASWDTIPSISVHCSSEFVLMKKFICSLMDACTACPHFLRTRGHQAKVVMCFLNVSELPLCGVRSYF